MWTLPYKSTTGPTLPQRGIIGWEFYPLINAIGVKPLKEIFFHCLWQCPVVQVFRAKIVSFTTQRLMNYVPFYPIWDIFGYIDLEEIPCTASSKKRLYMISATGLKTILYTLNHVSQPPFQFCLKILKFVMRMDWVEASTKKRNTWYVVRR